MKGLFTICACKDVSLDASSAAKRLYLDPAEGNLLLTTVCHCEGCPSSALSLPVLTYSYCNGKPVSRMTAYRNSLRPAAVMSSCLPNGCLADDDPVRKSEGG